MNTITITTFNYTGEYNFSSCCPKGAYFDNYNVTGYPVRSYQINSPTDFISRVTGYLTTKLLTFMGDDDTFNNIPALLEEAEQIMRLMYKAAHQSEYHMALIVKACSCINETIKTVNELECLDSIGAELHCIIWVDGDADHHLVGQEEASLEIYNEAGTTIETYYTL